MITPELPPTRGGLADYTEQLVLHWPGQPDFEFIVPKNSGAMSGEFFGHPVTDVLRNRSALATTLPSDGGAVLVQYSAYGFDRLGYPRWLIDGLLDWKQKTNGRMGIMFHEIWTFWPWWNKNFLVQRLHRRAIGQLLRVADVVLTTTASQAEHLSSLVPTCNARVLPVGTNIIPKVPTVEQRDRGTAVLFGMQGTRLRALRETANELRELARSQRVTRIVTVGGGNSSECDAEERAILESLRLPSGFHQVGAQPAEEVSTILASAEFGIAAQDPLSYTKSGTFMAYAAHGLNVLSNYADPSAQEPMCLLTSPACLNRGIDAAELRARAQKLRDWYDRTATWPRIAEEFARALRAPVGGAADK